MDRGLPFPRGNHTTRFETLGGLSHMARLFLVLCIKIQPAAGV